MKRFLPVIVLVLLATSAAHAETLISQPDMRHMSTKQLRALIPVESQSRSDRIYVKNRMVAVPGYEAMRKHYPAAANAAGQSGVAVLECQFDQMGNLHNCDTLAEMPQGYGFGAATIELAQKYFTMDMRGLNAEPNADWIKIIVSWPH